MSKVVLIYIAVLPDLVPNATMLEVSTYLDDVPMYYLSCAMEENCAAPSAYRIKQRYHGQRLFSLKPVSL